MWGKAKRCDTGIREGNHAALVNLFHTTSAEASFSQWLHETHKELQKPEWNVLEKVVSGVTDHFTDLLRTHSRIALF